MIIRILQLELFKVTTYLKNKEYAKAWEILQTIDHENSCDIISKKLLCLQKLERYQEGCDLLQNLNGSFSLSELQQFSSFKCYNLGALEKYDEVIKVVNELAPVKNIFNLSYITGALVSINAKLKIEDSKDARGVKDANKAAVFEENEANLNSIITNYFLLMEKQYNASRYGHFVISLCQNTLAQLKFLDKRYDEAFELYNAAAESLIKHDAVAGQETTSDDTLFYRIHALTCELNKLNSFHPSIESDEFKLFIEFFSSDKSFKSKLDVLKDLNYLENCTNDYLIICIYNELKKHDARIPNASFRDIETINSKWEIFQNNCKQVIQHKNKAIQQQNTLWAKGSADTHTTQSNNATSKKPNLCQVFESLLKEPMWRPKF